MNDQLVIGVDGGKSKTVCLVADLNGKIMGWGRAKSSDKYDVPVEQALDEITKSVHAALDQAGLTTKDIHAACFGLAGDDWPEDNQQLTAGLIEKKLADRILVKNDAQIALRANTIDGYGIVICAGTHLAAAIRTPDKEEWHSAWFSVQGMGGVDTGRKVFWSVLKAFDGRGQPTALTNMVLTAMNLESPLEMLRKLSRGELEDGFFSTLTPLLFKAHNQFGDPVAAGIIIELARDMSLWATGLMRRYNLLSTDLPVILTGGIFKSESPLLMDALSMEIHQHAPRAKLQHASYETVIGGLAYAYEMIGQPVTAELLSTLQSNLPDPVLFKTG